MQCTEINIQIDGFLDKQLNPEELLALDEHVSFCAECAEKLEIAKSLAVGLRNQPLPPHTAKFKQRVFAEVRSQHKENRQRDHGYSFAAGFATASQFGRIHSRSRRSRLRQLSSSLRPGAHGLRTATDHLRAKRLRCRIEQPGV